MDTATLAVLLTFGGTIVSALSAIGVAVIVNGRENKDSASGSAEKLEEKWRAFKDEQLQDLRQKNADLMLKWADAEARADREQDRADHLQMVLDAQRAEEQEQTDDR